MNAQSFTVRRSEAARPLVRVLATRLGKSKRDIRALLAAKLVMVNGQCCRAADRRVRPGEVIRIAHQPPKRPAEKFSGVKIRYQDEHLVIVEKPAGLTTMRHAHEAAEFGPRGHRYLPSTLADILPSLLTGARLPLRPVHRLDKETSGLVVFARGNAAARALSEQFRRHSVDRRYIAIVRGQARSQRIESTLGRDRGDGRRGSLPPPLAGKHAVTHVDVLEALAGFTLVACRLETGRTHQVRIHLGESGTPLVGEKVYDRPLHGRPILQDRTGFSRPALHAESLALDHPATGHRLSWSCPPPRDFVKLLQRLRKPGTDRSKR